MASARSKSLRRRPKQERARATVAALIEATARVLTKDGYERASTNRIAEVAGVNIGSVYQYFSSKDALVGALVDRHLDEVERVFAEHIAVHASAPLPEAVRALIRGHLLIHTNVRLHRVLLEQVPRAGRRRPIADFRARMKDLVRGWLAGRRSELRVEDLDFAAFAVVSIVDALTQSAIAEHSDVAEARVVDGIAEIVLRYLASDPPRRKRAADPRGRRSSRGSVIAGRPPTQGQRP